jgi:hypothetical protein
LQDLAGSLDKGIRSMAHSWALFSRGNRTMSEIHMMAALLSRMNPESSAKSAEKKGTPGNEVNSANNVTPITQAPKNKANKAE